MKYLSVCSGIEAATVAWHELGWEPVAFSEIEKFPSEVLKTHYPNVPNLGNMAKFKEWKIDPIDLLVGGTPCQSFSVAGLRKGLEDPRGNLALTYVAILNKFRPKWFIWENVPGVLSSNGGRDFGSFLGAVAELRYGFAYRVLDAQYFGVAQRRRRVFVVGCFGDWTSAAKVLFEPESLQRNLKPSRQKGKEVARCLTTGVGTRLDGETDTFVTLFEPRSPDGVPRIHDNVVPTLNTASGGQRTPCVAIGFNVNASGPTVMQPIPFDTTQITSPQNGCNPQPGDPCHPLTARGHPPAIIDKAGTLRANPGSGFRSDGTPVEGVAIQNNTVRRLTPVECERLQGFPDNYTNIKENCPDGPRYKALGNSMAVPVMKWIGEKIKNVEKSTT